MVLQAYEDNQDRVGKDVLHEEETSVMQNTGSIPLVP